MTALHFLHVLSRATGSKFLSASTNSVNRLLPCSAHLASQIRSYAKEAYQRDRPHLNIGTIGHVDHGKTTLTSAITKVLSEKNLAQAKTYADIDNAPQEKLRGITINVTTVEYQTENRHYSHSDCPGHADYIKNMIIGTSTMDGAILVVAATDGVMPQTKEHILLAKQIGLKNLIVFINKVDAADSEMNELVELEVRELLTEQGFPGSTVPFVFGSALNALEGKDPDTGVESIKRLMDTVDTHFAVPERALDKPFRLYLDSAYTVPGRGTIAGGQLEQGVLKKGADAELLGYGKKSKANIVSMETFKKSLDKAEAGDNIGVLLRAKKREDLKRGMVLCQAGSMTMHDKIECALYVLTKEEGGNDQPIRSYRKFLIFSKTWICEVQAILKDKDMIMPGENSKVTLRLNTKMPIEKGQQVNVRFGKHQVGAGVVSNILPDMTEDELTQYMESKKQREKRLAKDESAN